MSEKIKVKVTKGQANALNEIRGLHQDAHFLVMTATHTPDGGAILEGTEKAFDHLVRDLYDEVEFQMQPKRNLNHLRSLICELEPGGDF